MFSSHLSGPTLDSTYFLKISLIILAWYSLYWSFIIFIFFIMYFEILTTNSTLYFMNLWMCIWKLSDFYIENMMWFCSQGDKCIIKSHYTLCFRDNFQWYILRLSYSFTFYSFGVQLNIQLASWGPLNIWMGIYAYCHSYFLNCMKIKKWFVTGFSLLFSN